MIIKQFSLSNFGKHESLEFKCDAHVVGLLGPNGVGKSTVLDAIEFAITGEARDPLPSYVRHGEGNASVSMTFLKNGMEGYIFRQFGKTPKRKLVWDGREIKAAKEVDQTMAAIFGADKQAIANAVFINQGMLENILFSGDADRRQLFIKLVNMAFCEHRSHVIEGKIKKIQTTIVDLGPATDAAAEQQRLAYEAFTATKQSYDTMPDYTTAWSYCDRFIRTEEQLRQILTQIGSIEQEKQAMTAQLQAILDRWSQPHVDGAIAYMLGLETQAAQETASFTTWRTIKSELVHYNRVSVEIREKMGKLREQMAAQAKLNPDKLAMTQVEFSLTESTRWIEQQNARSAHLTNLETAKAQRNQAEEKFNACRKPRESAEQISVRKTALDQMGSTWNTLKGFLDKQQEFAKCAAMKRQTPSGQLQCVQCGLMISNPEALSEEAQAGTRQALEQLKLQIDVDTKVYVELNEELKECNAEKDRLARDFHYWENQAKSLEAMIAEIPEMDLSTIRVEHEKMSGIKALLPSIETAIKMLNEDIAKLMKQRQTYSLALSNLDRADSFTDEKEQEFSASIAETAEMLKEKRIALDAMKRLNTTISVHATQLDQYLTAKKSHEQILEQPMPPEASELSVALNGNLVAVRAELQARQDARNAAGGRMQQAETNWKEAQAAYQGLLQRAKADEEKRKLLEDLVVLRDLLRPEGLPLAVVQYHFTHLARLTQDALNQLDANFSIQIDYDTPLSFKFTRLDEPEHAPLPMNKLSGGQRVRLCTAFLIAVQQRLVSEVGLLVLDEPSTHVDQAGVESLAELLSSLSSQLGNTETQIIVSDHHPMLRTCFSKVLELA